MSRIFVIGSSNTDMVIKSPKLPAPGETIIGGEFLMSPGGKGANQAVAAARLGAVVIFARKIGNDIFGKQALEGLKREGIRTDYIMTHKDQPSGIALILVGEKGENCIAVASGANGTFRPEELKNVLEQIGPSDIVLLQLEIPVSVVEYAIKSAHTKGATVIFNPAPAPTPAHPLTDEIFSFVDIITPNETEAELLTGIKVTNSTSAATAATILLDRGVKHVIITLGAKGAYIHNKSLQKMITSPLVDAIDTTAAGDIFNGALAVALMEAQAKPETEAEGKAKTSDLESAVDFACRAAASSVTRLGAQSSAPKRHEIIQ
jgi:ribokinase